MSVGRFGVRLLRSQFATIALPVGTIAVAVGTLVGCAAEARPTPRNAPDWSRGIPLGETPLQLPVALQVDAGTATVAWADMEDRLRVARMGSEGSILEERTLELSTVAPRAPILLPHSAGGFHLLWLDGEGRDVAVYHSMLGPELRAVTMGRRLSPPEHLVTSLRAVPGSGGRTEIVWAAGPTERPGLFHLGLEDDGSTVAEPTLLAAEAEAPSLRMDVEGRLHLVWRQRRTYLSDDLYHALLDPEVGRLQDPSRLATVSRLSGQVLEGPDIVLVGDKGTLLWAVEDRVRGGSRLYGVPLSTEPSGTAGPQRLLLPSTHRPEYGASDGQGGPQRLAPMDGGGGSGFTTQPRAGDAGEDRAWVAVTTEVSTGARRDLQIAVVALSSQGPLGYQIVTATRRASLEPVLGADLQGALHLAWLETAGFGVYQVVYASTADGVRETWNRLTLRDVADAGLQWTNTLLLTVGFLPFMLIGWVAVPLAGLILFFLWTGEEELVAASSRLVLALAILLETVSMAYLVPSARIGPSATSLTGWLGRWETPLLVAIPAGGALVLYLRWSERPSLFPAFLVFALTHGTLRLALLAVSFAEVL